MIANFIILSFLFFVLGPVIDFLCPHWDEDIVGSIFTAGVILFLIAVGLSLKEIHERLAY